MKDLRIENKSLQLFHPQNFNIATLHSKKDSKMVDLKFLKGSDIKSLKLKSKFKSDKKPTIKLHSDIYRRHYSRWKEFKKMPKYDLDKPSVLNSGPYLGGKGR